MHTHLVTYCCRIVVSRSCNYYVAAANLGAREMTRVYTHMYIQVRTSDFRKRLKSGWWARVDRSCHRSTSPRNHLTIDRRPYYGVVFTIVRSATLKQRSSYRTIVGPYYDTVVGTFFDTYCRFKEITHNNCMCAHRWGAWK